MVGFISAHSPWNVISDQELPHSYSAFRDKLVLPSASTWSNICRREYTMTLDAIKKQLRSRKKVSLALDGWTLRRKLALTSVCDYYKDRNWASREVQLAFDEVDSPFFSSFESTLRISGQDSTYWSTASQTLEGCSWSFWADWRPFPSDYNR